jgi:hypothetical protein
MGAQHVSFDMSACAGMPITYSRSHSTIRWRFLRTIRPITSWLGRPWSPGERQVAGSRHSDVDESGCGLLDRAILGCVLYFLGLLFCFSGLPLFSHCNNESRRSQVRVMALFATRGIAEFLTNCRTYRRVRQDPCGRGRLNLLFVAASHVREKANAVFGTLRKGRGCETIGRMGGRPAGGPV